MARSEPTPAPSSSAAARPNRRFGALTNGITRNVVVLGVVSLLTDVSSEMLVYVIPLLGVAGSLAQKKRIAPSAGSVPTHSPQFVGLLAGVVLIMGGLAYFPAVSLGPVTEQVAMNRGTNFPAP